MEQSTIEQSHMVSRDSKQCNSDPKPNKMAKQNDVHLESLIDVFLIAPKSNTFSFIYKFLVCIYSDVSCKYIAVTYYFYYSKYSFGVYCQLVLQYTNGINLFRKYKLIQHFNMRH